LQYLARGCQSHNRKMQEALKGIKSQEELKKDENKQKQAAIQATNNLSSMIKDLFKNPPSFKSTLNLSWKTGSKAVPQKLVPTTGSASEPVAKSGSGDQVAAPKSENAAKRKPILPPEGSSAKVVKTTGSERKIYAPLSGKFSQTVKFAGFRGGRGGGYQRGGFRGGSRGRYTWRRF